LTIIGAAPVMSIVGPERLPHGDLEEVKDYGGPFLRGNARHAVHAGMGAVAKLLVAAFR
jgi:hypothetical protein